jgi:hypothetical protein
MADEAPPDMGYAYTLGQWKMGVTGDTIKFLLFLHCRLSTQSRTTSWKSLALLVTFTPQEPPQVPRCNPLRPSSQSSNNAAPLQL